MSDFKKETGGYVASERCYLTRDGKIVREGDKRAAQLLAPKGGLIPSKLGVKLRLDSASIESLPSAKKAEKSDVVSPTEIESRSTRPETVKHVR